MRRAIVLGSILLAGVLSAWKLGLSPAALSPGEGGWEMLGQFVSAAFSPALQSESDLGTNLLPNIASGVLHTILFATAAMSLALVVGAVLGVFASQSWWRLFPAARPIRPLLYGLSRALIAFMRSIHELLWALVLLSVFGLHPAAAVIAIAIPFSGTLAKVFSEMLDEAPDDAARAMRSAGAGPLQEFLFGLLPRALPDISAYAFYRFECALRSAAVLGFFGFPTLGKFIHESVGELYFHEAWSYLYALLAMIIIVEWWSGALRQRLTVA